MFSRNVLKVLAVTAATVISLSSYAKNLKTRQIEADSAIKGIAAVGGELITDKDVDERLKLLTMFSSKPLSEDSKQLLRKHVISALITEKLKVIYAKKINQSPDKEFVSQQQVDENFAGIAQSNGLSANEFKAKFAEHGVDVKTFFDQLYARLTWNAYIFARFGQQVHISDKDVSKKISHMKKMLSNKAYSVERFFIPFSTTDKKNKAEQTVKEIVNLLDAGIDFQTLVRQFSSGKESIIGGDLGFIADGGLPYKNENDAIKTMKPGEVRIVENNSGFSILKLNSTISKDDEIFEVRYVTIPLSSSPTQSEVEGKMRQIQNIVNVSFSASDMVKNAEEAKINVSQVISLPIEQIDPQLKELLCSASNGISRIVCSHTEVVCACIMKKRNQQIRIPSKEDVKEKMISDKLDLIAQHELEIARKSIFIDYKN